MFQQQPWLPSSGEMKYKSDHERGAESMYIGGEGGD